MDILNYRSRAFIYITQRIFKDEILSIPVATKDLSVSNLTLINIVNELNNIIAPVQVKISKRILTLDRTPDRSFDYCLSKIIKDSLEYSIMELLFFEEHTTYLSLAEQLFVSESTIKRTIRTMKTTLAKSNIFIETKPLCITGDEEVIRLFFITFFKERYGLFNLPFDQKLMKQLGYFYRFGSFLFRKKPTAQRYIHFVLSAIVSYEREIRHHQITLKNPTKIDLLANLTQSLPDQLFHLNKTFGPQDQQFYMRILYLFTQDTALDSAKDYLKEAMNDPNIKEFLTLYCKIFNLQMEYSQLEALSLELYEIIYGYRQPHSNYDFTLADQYKDFYDLNNFVMDSYQLVAKELFEYCFAKEYHACFYFVFFSLTTNFPNLLDTLYEKYHTIRITILIDFDYGFANYIRSKLIRLLPGNPQFKIISLASDLNLNEVAENSDLLITNILDASSLKTPENMVVSVSHYLTQADFSNILHAVISKYKHNYTHLLKESATYFNDYVNQHMDQHPKASEAHWLNNINYS